MCTSRRSWSNALAVLSATLLLAIAFWGALAPERIQARPSANAAPPLAGELVSYCVATPPVIDGQLDDAWLAASWLTIPLTHGVGGQEHAFDMQLRAIHTADTAYMIARWPGKRPSAAPDELSNRLTMHFDLPEPWPGAREVSCLVACHTAFADERGQLAYMVADTIPPLGSDMLTAAGGWSEGCWLLEWSRPMASANKFDVQFEAGDRTYPFFVKVLEHRDGFADPVSGQYALSFRR